MALFCEDLIPLRIDASLGLQYRLAEWVGLICACAVCVIEIPFAVRATLPSLAARASPNRGWGASHSFDDQGSLFDVTGRLSS